MNSKINKVVSVFILCCVLLNVVPHYSAIASISLTVSNEGIELIKQLEGCEKTAYQDSVGVWTIGYGHTTGVTSGMTITQEKADEYLRSDVSVAEKQVLTFLKKYSISVLQNQFDALVSWTFNLGNRWVQTEDFKLRTYLINGVENYTSDEIRTAFTNWSKAGGVVLQGLINRRNAEADLFLRNVVEDGNYIDSQLSNIKSTIINNQNKWYVDKAMIYYLKHNDRVKRNLDSGKSVVFFFDGCSDNVFMSNFNYQTNHMSTYVAVVKLVNSIPKIVYENENSSTIPDNPRLVNATLAGNTGTDMPTVVDGIHDIVTKNHKGEYAALHLRDSGVDVNVIRCNSSTYYSSTSSGINVHARSWDYVNTSTYSSTGCFNVGVSSPYTEYNNFIYQITGKSNAKTSTYPSTGDDVGIAIVDRYMYKDTLLKLYNNSDLVENITAYSTDLFPNIRGLYEENEPLHTIDSTYSHYTPFSATAKCHIDVFNENHTDPGNRYIDLGEKCTIHEVYTDGCCKVEYPTSSGTSIFYAHICDFDYNIGGNSVISQSWITDPSNGSYFILHVSATNCTYIDMKIVSVKNNEALETKRLGSSEGDFEVHINTAQSGHRFIVQLLPDGKAGCEGQYVTYNLTDDELYVVVFPNEPIAISSSTSEITIDLANSTEYTISVDIVGDNVDYNNTTYRGYDNYFDASDVGYYNNSHHFKVRGKQVGDSTFYVWVHDTNGDTAAVLEIPVHIIDSSNPNIPITLRVWFSYDGYVPEHFYTDEKVFLNYTLTNSNTGEAINSICNKNYSCYMEIISPDGIKVNNYTYENSDNNWISIPSNKEGSYIRRVVVTGDITDTKETSVFLDSKNADTTKPSASITVTNNVATTQTVTVKMSDNDELAGYYWGTDSSLTPSFTSISGTEKTVTKMVSSVGTYYLTVKDKTGNTYQTSVEFSKLVLNANGGSVTPEYVIVKTQNSVNLPTPKKSGFTFNGWAISASASSGLTGEYTVASGTKTLYAVWKVKEYTVSYNANGGIGAPSSQTKYYGTDLTLSSTVPTKTGYTFLGWGTSSNATTIGYAVGDIYSADSDITLYAVWEAEQTVILGDVNNDGVVNAKDRIDLTRYLAHWEDYPESSINMEAADVNCDGVVNAKDRIGLTRYLAHWSGYESLPVK